MTPAQLDFSKVIEWSKFVSNQNEDSGEFDEFYRRARGFLEFYNWCGEILESYVGMLYPEIVGIFLFKILPSKTDIDEWVWVIVGDLPPAYITIDECPNPAAALDGYIGAMLEWIDAARNGQSVANLIPVNAPATFENAMRLKSRLDFLDERILPAYQEDLKA